MRKHFIIILTLACTMMWAQNPWNGKRVAVIGDSISDSTHVGTTRCWWEYVSDSLGLNTTCYAKNGATVENMQGQVAKMLTEEEHWDLILIFGGTNDYNGNVPMGNIFTQQREKTNKDGHEIALTHRAFNMDNSTFSGRINNLLSTLKEKCPETRILVLTPIHRGFAQFGSGNVQPDELWSNTENLFLEDYIDCLQQASRAWAVPCLDLSTECGLLPMYRSNDAYVHRVDTDRLHPNAKGHERMAKVVLGYLRGVLPY